MAVYDSWVENVWCKYLRLSIAFHLPSVCPSWLWLYLYQFSCGGSTGSRETGCVQMTNVNNSSDQSECSPQRYRRHDIRNEHLTNIVRSPLALMPVECQWKASGNSGTGFWPFWQIAGISLTFGANVTTLGSTLVGSPPKSLLGMQH